MKQRNKKRCSLDFKKVRSKNVGLLLAVFIFLVSAIIIPYFTWFVPERDFQVMGDFEVFGFDTVGWIEVKHAVGNRFTFIRESFNVSIPYEDCEIDSLKVVKGSEKGSAFYDVVLFNGTGKLEITATNIIYFSYQLLEENATAVMHFVNPQVRSFLVESGYPSTDVLFTLEDSDSESVSISVLERSCDIFLGFGADNGSLMVSGSQNFSLPLIEDRAGILLEVSVPINRAYTTQIKGKLDQVYLDDWETIGYVFLRGLSHTNYFLVMRPKGEFSYDGKRKEVLGSQDLNFTSLAGAVYIMPTSNPNLFRVLMGGNIYSILSESAGRISDLTEKSYLDILFPIPISGMSLLLGVLVWYIWNPRKDAILIPSTILFFLGSLAWAVKTEQPLWVQNLFGYTSLFVTTIIYLAGQKEKKSKENKFSATKPDTTVENEKEANIEENTDSLARLVDSKYQHRKLSRRKVGAWVLLQILAISTIFYIIFILQPYINEPAIYVSFFVGIVTIYVALNTSINIQFELASKEVIKWNYESLKDKAKTERPLLLALIKMKNKQPDLLLIEMMKESPSLFVREKLLERLYE